ncbi:MAG: hypothetical protein JW774_06020 [Candidatus Aureabacteria bacterium]|nr:hypothetical protein [Candidatus Auribacterota bacterium]
MKKSYHVCLWMPKDYPHSLGLFELAVLLKSTFDTLGVSCSLKLNQLEENKINIILAWHLVKMDSSLMNYSYIPYQLEQLTRLRDQTKNSPDYFKNMEAVLRHAYAVWDYSPENIDFLKGLDIHARYVPIGYHSALEQIADRTQKDIDILFYGSRDERRNRILDALNHLPNIRTHLLFGCYGKERDAFISRSKIIWNIHNEGTDQFEQVRISYLLNNRCFILSEPSEFYPYPEVEIPFISADKLAEKSLFYLSNPDTMNMLRKKSHEQFKTHYPMKTILENTL